MIEPRIEDKIRTRLPKNISISSEKTLVQFTADSPRVSTSILRDLHSSKIVVFTKLSDVFKKAFPIVLAMIILGGVALAMGNAPMIIDAIAKTTGTEKKVVTETRIVYLTEEEARAQGMTVNSPTPPPLNPIPEDTNIAPADADNPRLEGFDVAGNLIPKIQAPDGGFDFNKIYKLGNETETEVPGAAP